MDANLDLSKLSLEELSAMQKKHDEENPPLLPCPFCGDDAWYAGGESWRPSSMDGYCSASCSDHSCLGHNMAIPKQNRAEAAKKWNTRAKR